MFMKGSFTYISEPPLQKTNNLHMRKQRHLCFYSIDSMLPLLSKFKFKASTPSVPVIQSVTLRRRLIQLDAARGGRWSQVS